MEKYGVSEITDDLLSRQVTTTVDAGLGASDPMQKLQKISVAFQTAGPIIAKGVESGDVEIQYQEVINAVFGAAGFSDAGDRFAKVISAEEKGPPPEQIMAQMEQEEKQKDRDLQFRMKEIELDSQEAIESAKLSMQLTIEKMKISTSMTQNILGMLQGDVDAERANAHGMALEDKRSASAMEQTKLKGRQGMAQLTTKGQQADKQLNTKGEQAMSQLDAKGQQGMEQLVAKGDQAQALAASKPVPKGAKVPAQAPRPAPGAAIAELSEWAKAQIPIMQQMFSVMQQMQEQMNAPTSWETDPASGEVKRVMKGNRAYIPRRGPMGDIEGFDPEDAGLPGLPPPGGPPGPAGAQPQLPPPPMPGATP